MPMGDILAVNSKTCVFNGVVVGSNPLPSFRFFIIFLLARFRCANSRNNTCGWQRLVKSCKTSLFCTTLYPSRDAFWFDVAEHLVRENYVLGSHVVGTFTTLRATSPAVPLILSLRRMIPEYCLRLCFWWCVNNLCFVFQTRWDEMCILLTAEP